MPVEVILPKLSTTMDEGTIVRWLKDEGHEVESGEILFEVETDKAVMEVEAPATGVLAQILSPAGSTVPVAQVVAYITSPGERLGESPLEPPASPAPQPAAVPERRSRDARQQRRAPTASPLARKLAQQHNIDLAAVKGSGAAGRIVERDVREAIDKAKTTQHEPERFTASPVARRLAKELGVDLSAVSGTGPGGRIVLEDVQRAAERPAPVEQAITLTGGQAVPLSGVRRVIASRMAESARTAARVTLTTEVDASSLVSWRSAMKAEQEVEPAPSYTDIVVFLVARALRENPRLNARLEGEAIRLLDPINIGLATHTEHGLLVPVVRDVDHKALWDIARESRRLVEKARAGKATPDELTGGTFTVTNLGMYEVDAFTPIINLPECAILGLGRIVAKPVVVQGRIAVGQMMALSLSFDHRLVDGAPAARFLQRVKQLIEEPVLAF